MGVFQLEATDPLSKKKNAVAANMPIEINQKVIPTKSSEARMIVSAYAKLEYPPTAKAVRTNNLIFFIKKSLKISFFSLNSNYKILLTIKSSMRVNNK